MKIHLHAAIAIAAALVCTAPQAANHALILTIDYAGTSAALPGIARDAQIAESMARDLGVPAGNVVSVRNSDLTVGGLRSQLTRFAGRVGSQDNVFIYYSGHGAQVQAAGSASCAEGMVGADLQLFYSNEITPLLQKIAATAARTVVLNDSCFSGGQFRDKSTATRSAGSDSVPKFMDMQTKAPADGSGYQCGAAINKTFRDLGPVATNAGNQLVYLAAASDRELAFATPNGSSATLAWSACLSNRRADRNNDGAISGEELQACAQEQVRSMGFNQTITLAGFSRMPIVHGAPSTAGASCAEVNPSNLLEGIRSNAVGQLELSVANPRLRIGKDMLDFNVRTAERGYLYLLHVGSTGNFHLLFPNKLDGNNEVGPGTHRFPRASWGVQAQGPQPGTSRLMALLLPNRIKVDSTFDMSSTFGKLAADSCRGQKDLGIVSREGRTSASQVVSIEEIN